MLKLFVKVQALRSVVVDESGQDLIEYALLGALLAVACVTGISSVASKVSTVFASIVTAL